MKGLVSAYERLAAKCPEKVVVPILLGAISLLFIILAFLSGTFSGGGDTITHYLFSRYSWQQPHFLLDHWAKPVFTLISSPFAQFGLRGVVIMNILLGVFSALIAWDFARRLKMANAWIIPLLLCFSPVYTMAMLSGLTEIMFGFFLIAAMWLFVKERFVAGAILIGFSFLVRTEGVFLIPVFGLFLLAFRRYKALPFLLTGFVFYSIVGWMYFGDPFWLITHMPYQGATDIYGTGPLLHFARHAPDYFNPLFAALLVTGIIANFFTVGRSAEKWLAVFVFLVYFIAHSLMWWSGIGNSLGLTRYMAAMGPPAAIVSLVGLNAVIRLGKPLFPNNTGGMLRTALLLIIVLVMVRSPFRTLQIPQQLHGMDLVVKQATDFIREEELHHQKVYYYDPAVVVHLDLNPFDGISARERVFSNENPQLMIEPGSIVIWDAHFAGNGGLDAAALLSSPFFELLGRFTPDEEIIVFGRDYQVLVFQRNDSLDGTEGDQVSGRGPLR